MPTEENPSRAGTLRARCCHCIMVNCRWNNRRARLSACICAYARIVKSGRPLYIPAYGDQKSSQRYLLRPQGAHTIVLYFARLTLLMTRRCAPWQSINIQISQVLSTRCVCSGSQAQQHPGRVGKLLDAGDERRHTWHKLKGLRTNNPKTTTMNFYACFGWIFIVVSIILFLPFFKNSKIVEKGSGNY